MILCILVLFTHSMEATIRELVPRNVEIRFDIHCSDRGIPQSFVNLSEILIFWRWRIIKSLDNWRIKFPVKHLYNVFFCYIVGSILIVNIIKQFFGFPIFRCWPYLTKVTSIPETRRAHYIWVRVARSLVFCVMVCLFLSFCPFSFWPLSCLSFNLRRSTNNLIIG